MALRNIDLQTPAAGVSPHVLPSLPYDLAALEPYIDARTMALHHGQHHAGYVQKLNATLDTHAALRGRSTQWLLCNLGAIDETIRFAVQQNAGGHLNHSIFWRGMAPATGTAPSGPLAAAIDTTFGSLGTFKSQFAEAGAKVFGSGWVWLVSVWPNAAAGQHLEIVTTSGHDNPLQQGKQPLLVNDVWEHAYYLKYANKRAEYLRNWWPIVNWTETAARFELARHAG